MSAHPDGGHAVARHRACRIAISIVLAGLAASVFDHEDAADARSSSQPGTRPTIYGQAEELRGGPIRNGGVSSTIASASGEAYAPQILPPPPRISGQVTHAMTGAPISGVTLAGLRGGPVTNPYGVYWSVVDPGWTGTVRPTKAGYYFSPPSRTYTRVSVDQDRQNYTGGPAPVLSVTPVGGLTSIGPEGGPFNPDSREYTVSNVGAATLYWSATKTQPWLSLSAPTSGTLEPGESTTVTVSVNSAAAELDIGTHSDVVSFINTTIHMGDTTRSVQVSVTAPGSVSWTNRGFDLQVAGALAAQPWDQYTNDRYVIVPQAATVAFTIVRNASLRRADHSPSPADNTRVHVGLLTIAGRQFWTPDWDSYVADGSFVYASPFSLGPIDEPTPVQIWNQHPGCDFDSSDWLAYGSNAMEVWLIPDQLAPGNLPPVDYLSGRLPARQLASATAGAWPALYRDAADEIRLHNAVEKLGSDLYGDGGPYDDSSYGNYWRDLADWAARNALVGWHTGSSAHLNEARQQLLGLVSVRTFTNEYAMWGRARCVPNADFTTSYGRELSNIFFDAMIAACALGPHMSDALAPDELDSVNAHLFRFAIQDIFASLTLAQYYTANGSINLHYHPICVTAGWNWNVPEAVSIAALLPQPTHTECIYFMDEQGIGQYALRYCEWHDPADKNYEHVGNSQSVRYWLRFSEFFGQTIDVEAAEHYVVDHYSGLSLDCRDGLDALMDGWQP
jgi:hypothetical protein